jgi:dihydroorotate dehydrogenase (NAD+) catalytic subunit
MNPLAVKLPGLDMKNPIMPASGCFSFGKEFAEVYDLSILGAITLKSTTLNRRLGNAVPRVAECTQGMLNSVGLQNPGVNDVINYELERLSKFDTNIIFNVAGASYEEYEEIVRRITVYKGINAIELNISCPNVKEGGIQFGTDPDVAANLTEKVKKISTLPLYVKLSPNVTDIVKIAEAVVQAGADGLSLINTLIGMRLDYKTGKPILSNVIGGLSGPAIMPVAIRMVYQVACAVNVPIIGMGGIKEARDVIEFISAGASAVAVGSYNFINPYVMPDIIQTLPSMLDELGVNSISALRGRAL